MLTVRSESKSATSHDPAMFASRVGSLFAFKWMMAGLEKTKLGTTQCCSLFCGQSGAGALLGGLWLWRAHWHSSHGRRAAMGGGPASLHRGLLGQGEFANAVLASLHLSFFLTLHSKHFVSSSSSPPLSPPHQMRIAHINVF